MSERENEEGAVMGIKVTRKKYPDTELIYELCPIPADLLADIIRRKFRPILDMEEARRPEKNYVLLDGFAATADMRSAEY
jgi:hypothetical protein